MAGGPQWTPPLRQAEAVRLVKGVLVGRAKAAPTHTSQQGAEALEPWVVMVVQQTQATVALVRLVALLGALSHGLVGAVDQPKA
mgnify:CR=1 FL=1